MRLKKTIEHWKQSGAIWPVAVVILLLSSVTLMASVIVAARSDGGAQVVENYYDQAVDWDSTASIRANTGRRNYVVALSVRRGADSITGALSIQDSLLAHISSLIGRVTVSRPQFASSLFETDISWDKEHSVYTFVAPIADLASSEGMAAGQLDGLWDFSFLLTDSDAALLFEFRKDLR